MSDEQEYILKKMKELPVRAFQGSIDALDRVQCLINAEIDLEAEGVMDEVDQFLNQMYETHTQFILECFFCFRKGVPMRLLKLPSERVRIICDECREKLAEAGKPN